MKKLQWMLCMFLLLCICGCRQNGTETNLQNNSVMEAENGNAATSRPTNTKKSSTQETYATPKKSEKTNQTRKTCIACKGTGKMAFYATTFPWEEPYYGPCSMCDSKGYYWE